MLSRLPPTQQIENQKLFGALKDRLQRIHHSVMWNDHILALHYSVDDLEGPLQWRPLCFTTRVTVDRNLLTRTTGINKEFRFVYALCIPQCEIEFDPEGFGRFEAKLKKDASVWEIQTYDPVYPEEYIKVPVNMDDNFVNPCVDF